jgi:translation initiation factor IF-2
MSDSTIQSRPPIVTIMGHIDHGKTSLLDYIRKANVTAGEAGGITQHIGSYQVSHKDATITFIDTPGHEAFKSIRSRGIRTADIIIIVIAGDEGVKPQTLEAIELAKSTQLPIIVAITKIDKPNLVLDKIKADLAELELTPEEWGGQTIVQNVSSVSGEGIPELLEMIALVAEVEELKANYDSSATDGFILESFLDSKAGPLSDIVVLNGKLKLGDVVLVGNTVYGKIRRMTNDSGVMIKEALPAQPARILGLKNVASAGDEFRVVASENDAMALIEAAKIPPANNPVIQSLLEKEKTLNLIIKADSIGSLDAIEYALGQIVQLDIKITIVGREVGDITANDIAQAKVQQAVILGFGIKQDKNIKELADLKDVAIKYYRLIYELIDEIRDQITQLEGPKLTRTDLGELKVLKVFKEDKKSLILGGLVQKGRMVRNGLIEIENSEGKVIVQGKLTNLQQDKQDVSDVADGNECGMVISCSFKKTTPVAGDILYVYEQIKK